LSAKIHHLDCLFRITVPYITIKRGLRPALSSLFVPTTVWSTKPKLDRTILILSWQKLWTITLLRYTVHVSAHKDPTTFGAVIAELDHI